MILNRTRIERKHVGLLRRRFGVCVVNFESLNALLRHLHGSIESLIMLLALLVCVVASLLTHLAQLSHHLFG